MKIVRIRKTPKANKDRYNYHQYNRYGDNQSKYDDQELRAMLHSPVKQSPGSNLFCLLAQQLLWNNIATDKSKGYQR